jgi:hypothetical protein
MVARHHSICTFRESEVTAINPSRRLAERVETPEMNLPVSLPQCPVEGSRYRKPE